MSYVSYFNTCLWKIFVIILFCTLCSAWRPPNVLRTSCRWRIAPLSMSAISRMMSSEWPGQCTGSILLCSCPSLLLIRYADISPAPGQHFIFALEKTVEVPNGYVGFSLVQRKWAMLSINQELEVRPYRFDANSDVITSVSFETDFLQKKT